MTYLQQLIKSKQKKKRTSQFDKSQDWEYQLSVDDGKLDRFFQEWLKQQNEFDNDIEFLKELI